jgi:hypothetical protein
MNMTGILSAIDAEISKLQQARAIFTDYSDPIAATATATATPAKRGPGRPKKTPEAVKPAKKAAKRVMSEEARSKIAAAQKKRWAASKKATK